ncbi:hypothetical protein JCM10212_003428 [Sporobolomyces blumeae]
MSGKELPWTAPTPTRLDRRRSSASRRALGLVVLAVVALILSNPTTSLELAHDSWTTLEAALRPLPRDAHQRALALMSRSPLIGPFRSASAHPDGHIDLPILTRYLYANQLDNFDLDSPTKGQVDIPRLIKGKVGGFFWSVFVPCPEDAGFPSDNDGNFTTSTWRVRDTLEQIDTARLLISKYSDTFELVSTAKEWRRAMRRGKIAGMLGVEGGHQIGSSLSAIRTYFALGVRYITLTHTCNNALADSCGTQTTSISSRWDGLSPFGVEAVKESNRLGMIIDLSHTAPKTASDALSVSEAPVIFSHSNARGVHAAVRNVPDSILRRIGRINHPNRSFNLTEDGEGGKGWGADTGEAEKAVKAGDTIIMLNFSPDFVSQWPDKTGRRANVSLVADHADYIGKLAGRDKIGIGSDFDGILDVPEGLSDTSEYPNLITELIRRGWSDKEIKGVTGENMLRILEKVEQVAHRLRHVKPSTAIFEGRTDLVKHDHY